MLGAGSTAAATLTGASALHALWATGSSWPTSSPDELADLVVGRRPMPGRAACATVAAALAVAAGATACAARGRPGRLTDRSRTMAVVVSASLLVRGVGGIAADLAGKVDATPAFRRWNRRLYNPLCITLAILVAVGRRNTDAASTRERRRSARAWRSPPASRRAGRLGLTEKQF